MSYFKTNNIIGKLELSGFRGIDLSSPASEGTCTDMVNLRILPDRSIVKRDGYREVLDLTDNVRGIFSGEFDGEFAVYAVAGSALYKINIGSKSKTLIGNVSTQSGPVSIFYHAGRIYVIDGKNIFEVRENALHVTEGYVPFIGKDWGSNYPGEIYEPRNALTPRGMISYIVDDPPTAFLATYYEVDSVNAVYVNGELRSSDSYSINHRFRTLDVAGLEAGDKVLAYYTFTSTPGERERLVSNPYATVFGGINNSRLFMWGGEDKSRMFVSSPALRSSMETAERVFANAGGLYFPEQNDFCVGDGKYEIKAVSRHYDRLLIFTSGETWMADSEVSSSQGFPLMRINTDIGCALIGGVAKCGNDPISIGHRDIYRWTSNTDTLEDCNAYVISDKIKAMLPRNFFDAAVVFTDKQNREVLFAYHTVVESKIFVYSIPCEEWYVYEGIFADLFFETKDALGFVSGSKICVFEPNSTTDVLLNGTLKSISAFCRYSAESFGSPTRKKRIAGVMGVADMNGGELNISFESERGVMSSVRFAGTDPGRVECFYTRHRGERFKNSRIKISTDTITRQRIYSLTVTARA